MSHGNLWALADDQELDERAGEEDGQDGEEAEGEAGRISGEKTILVTSLVLVRLVR